MKVSDAICGALLVLCGALVFLHAQTFPSPPPPAYGPALFPMLAALALALCGGLLILRTVIAGDPILSARVGEWIGSPHHLGNLVITLGGIIGFVLVADTIGFVAFAALLLAAGYLWLGVRWYLVIPISLVGAYAIQLLFVSLLRIPLPVGTVFF